MLTEKSNINSSQGFIHRLTEKINIEVSSKESGAGRGYNITADAKFNVFEGHLNSELKTRKLNRPTKFY